MKIRIMFYLEKQASNGALHQMKGRPQVTVQSSIHHPRINSTRTHWETSVLQLLVEMGAK